ncbi:MAG: DUF2252 domain-containing protein [Actinobacteria bacterium]|nr:DUF2252 domain-containing protein [Actinomycetota bacterium]
MTPPEHHRPKAIRDRLAAGRAEREAVPLEAHAEVDAGPGRPDPVELLTDQDATRLQELVPIRHGRMRATPFTFYRGAAAIMASDLSRTPTTGLRVQLCGDAHLSNFGVFNGPDRRLVFDLNDFDETLPGPFEWDLKRLAASVTIAGRHREHSTSQVAASTRAAVRGYRRTIAGAVDVSPLDVHYRRLDVEAFVADTDGKIGKQARATAKKASRKTSLRALDKLTEVVDGRRRIVSRPPEVVRIDDLVAGTDRDRISDFFDRYRATLPPHRAAVIDRYRFVDIAHKIVGVGSVGTRCLIVLLECDLGTPLFMQFKEANPSVLEPYCGETECEQQGERVVRGQRLLQSAGDILLGWSRYHRPDGGNADFYFRQLWDGKGSADVDVMGPKRLERYAELCGGALALAHARAGDAALISGYLGDDRTIDDVLVTFAEAYADLNERDHTAHGDAIRAGRVPAVDEPEA